MVVAAEYITRERSGEQGRDVTGILAVQGAFAEHAAMLDRLHAPWRLLRSKDDWDGSIDRVILPGGESTTQGRLLRSSGLFGLIAAHIAAGRPVLGTCAGMILLARRLENDEHVWFRALDATVRRNAYGRQLGSFRTTGSFGDLHDVPLVFIRGPVVADVGPEATVETIVDGRPVAVRQNRIIATAFHPELTPDTRIHELFLSL
ncbi:pyridoxal 5'-phosphate synthase glutaminase subunit PdxT [uncultured Bifidobacterium sp.]|uniref:pyridoxal 5'-phosphate synthase glutaminase subunit PdxT n=1 Tax=uncultured Bifidobacterium sp. TaxID=165187 RepID=UPI0028DB3C2E|nr:pyridoxal 5'-phosphate synthase glutaminase subunit PdxT [uncultured Bifidobacterium sp.]